MNRLQKKCLIAATGFHLLLVVILLVGPAFLASHDKTKDMAVLDFIPAKLIDAPFSGGGTPNAKPPPPAPLQQEVTPPTPPTPAPQKIEPPAPKPPEAKTILEKIFEPAPKETPKETPKSEEPDPISTKKPVVSKPKMEVSLKTVKRSANSTTPTKSKEQVEDTKARDRAAAAERKEAINRSLRNLRDNLSSGTTVDIPGPGGAAYANYAQIVKSVYTQAWIAPTDVADDESTAKVSVTIARDGTVLSARVTQPSGSAPVDRSVQQTLNRVKFVAPFPEGAKEPERTFIINFNLKAKRLLG